MKSIKYTLLNLTKVGCSTSGFFVYQKYAYKHLMEGSFLNSKQYRPLAERKNNQFNILPSFEFFTSSFSLQNSNNSLAFALKHFLMARIHSTTEAIRFTFVMTNFKVGTYTLHVSRSKTFYCTNTFKWASTSINKLNIQVDIYIKFIVVCTHHVITQFYKWVIVFFVITN